MKFFIYVFLVSVIASTNLFARSFQLTSEVGFLDSTDKIVAHQVISEDRILVIGKKKIQLWDYRDGKLLYEVPHEIKQFAPKGVFTKYILLSIAVMLDWKPFVVEPDGKWLITSERINGKGLRVAVVRELDGLKTIAKLELPGVSAEMIALDSAAGEIKISGRTDKTGAFAAFDSKSFQRKHLFKADSYKWHRLVANGKKAIVGTGDTKIDWPVLNEKQGEFLTLRDVETGKIETEFKADGLKRKNTFKYTTVTIDEKYLLSFREDRVFVWEVVGNGSPVFEVAARPDEKGDLDFEAVLGDRAFAVAVDEKIRVYSIGGNGDPLLDIASETDGDSIEYIDSTDDGKYVAVRDDEILKVFDLDTRAAVIEIKRENEKEKIKTVKFFDEKGLLSVSFANFAEKKGSWTEFYDYRTGKQVSRAHVGFSSNVVLAENQDLLIDENLGRVIIWNLEKQEAFFVGLKQWEPESDWDDEDPIEKITEPHNLEDASLNPAGTMLLRHGDDVVAVYDLASRKQVASLFDPKRVKYNKKTGRVKKSGLDDAAWTPDGEYVYALGRKSQKIFFWKAE